MRISSANRFDAAIANLQERQVELSKAQLQMTTGKRTAVPSDDPTAVARAERALATQHRVDAVQRALAASRSGMSLAESALGSAGDLLQSARETIVAAGNGSYSPTARSALAAQLKQIRAQLLTVANQGDGNGGYVFGGQGSQCEPLLDGIGGVKFAGTAGEASLSSQESMPAAVDGQSTWLSARSGNGVFVTGADPANTGTGWIDSGGVSDPAALTGHSYTIQFSVTGGSTTYSVLDGGAPTAVSGAPYSPGSAITADGQTFHVSGQPADGDRFTLTPSSNDLDPFAALDRAIAVIDNPSANSGQLAQAVSSGLRDLDSVMGHLQAARSAAGATLSRLDQIDSRSQDRMLWAQTVQSNAEDIDMVQAISTFQNHQTSYQSALQSYAMVQRLSLFDYLK